MRERDLEREGESGKRENCPSTCPLCFLSLSTLVHFEVAYAVITSSLPSRRWFRSCETLVLPPPEDLRGRLYATAIELETILQYLSARRSADKVSLFALHLCIDAFRVFNVNR